MYENPAGGPRVVLDFLKGKSVTLCFCDNFVAFSGVIFSRALRKPVKFVPA